MTFPSEEFDKVRLALAQRIGLTPNDVVLAAFKLGWWELVARWARLDGQSTESWLSSARAKVAQHTPH